MNNNKKICIGSDDNDPVLFNNLKNFDEAGINDNGNSRI
jgi:hypothetical protein